MLLNSLEVGSGEIFVEFLYMEKKMRERICQY